MTDRNTRTLSPIVEQQAPAADLRLYRVGATATDDEFYVRCESFEMAAEVVVQRATLKKQRVVYRPIAEVTSG